MLQGCIQYIAGIHSICCRDAFNTLQGYIQYVAGMHSIAQLLCNWMYPCCDLLQSGLYVCLLPHGGITHISHSVSFRKCASMLHAWHPSVMTLLRHYYAHMCVCACACVCALHIPTCVISSLPDKLKSLELLSSLLRLSHCLCRVTLIESGSGAGVWDWQQPQNMLSQCQTISYPESQPSYFYLPFPFYGWIHGGVTGHFSPRPLSAAHHKALFIDCGAASGLPHNRPSVSFCQTTNSKWVLAESPYVWCKSWDGVVWHHSSNEWSQASITHQW